MCGNHHHTGVDGSGHPMAIGPIFRPRPTGGATVSGPHRRPGSAQPGRSRRAFLGEVGRGTLALAVVTPVLVACGGSSGDSSSVDQPATTAGGPGPAPEDTTATPPAADTGSAPDGVEGATEAELRWARADLGFVSAFVLARGNQAAIVDTGVAGSADAIGESLSSLGLNYGDVEHVILTHKHGDHAGSIAEVVARAERATVYAGQADLDEIDADAVVPLAGGEDVFGLEMLATPGHTAGHMAVIDHTSGLLVAGDAIWTEDGGVAEGPARFFDDIPSSQQTIRDLAQLSFNTLLVGHGEPIEAGADSAMAALADSLA